MKQAQQQVTKATKMSGHPDEYEIDERLGPNDAAVVRLIAFSRSDRLAGHPHVQPDVAGEVGGESAKASRCLMPPHLMCHALWTFSCRWGTPRRSEKVAVMLLAATLG